MTYELVCIAAAILFTALGARARRAGRPARALGTTALVFWGAALMWSVDCVHGFLFPEEGEAPQLFDLSREDAILGGIVLVAGLIVFAVLANFESECKAEAQASR